MQRSPVSSAQLPTDFDLGPIDLTDEASRETAVSLLESIRHPETEVLLVPRWKDFVLARVALARAEQWSWQAVRWGPRHSSGSWREFVLRSERKTIKGQVFLQADDKGRWMVEDFQWQELTANDGFLPTSARTGGQLLP